MTTESSQLSLTRIAVVGGGVVLIVMGMHALADTIAQAFAALVIALTWLPALRWMRAKGWPGWVGVLIAGLSTLAIVGGIIFLIGASIVKIAAQAPSYERQFDNQLATMQQQLAASGLDAAGAVASASQMFRELLTVGAAFAANLLSLVSSAAFAILIFVFMLLEQDSFLVRLRVALGPKNPYMRNVAAFATSVTTYMLTRAWLGLLAAAGDIILLWFVGVPYVLLWGILSFVGSFIPYVGYWIALIPPTLLALVLYGPGPALVVFLGYWLINGVIDNVLGPRVMGKALNLSPVVTILVVFFWGWVLGPVGAMLSVPLTTLIIFLILDPFPFGRRVAVLLSMDAPSDADALDAVEQATPAPALTSAAEERVELTIPHWH